MRTLAYLNGDQMPILGLGTWKSDPGQVYHAVTSALLLSVLFSNVLSSVVRYGDPGFLFWADLLSLIASYVMILPAALRQLCGTDVGGGRPRVISQPRASRRAFFS